MTENVLGFIYFLLVHQFCLSRITHYALKYTLSDAPAFEVKGIRYFLALYNFHCSASALAEFNQTPMTPRDSSLHNPQKYLKI
jgi:hypothetical protein